MKAYVLGAGASYAIYPLGSELLDNVSNHVVNSDVDYQSEWHELIGWLKGNSDPLLKQSYRNKNIEQLFTILDLAELLLSDSRGSVFRASQTADGVTQAEAAARTSFSANVQKYRDARLTLLRAMEDFFLERHQKDLEDYSSPRWDNLKRLGDLIQPDDVVITFNYDSTIERVLFKLGKWAFSDGYGAELVLQQSRHDKTLACCPPSKVKVLHIAWIGWVVQQACLCAKH